MPSSSSISTGFATTEPARSSQPSGDARRAELKQVFTEFTAGTFYREMLSALRKSHAKPAYFDGGQAEEVFREQLDRTIADNLAAQHGEAFAAPMFDTFANQVLTGPRA